MSTTEITASDPDRLLEQVLIMGDLSKLSAADRLRYYQVVCDSVKLNPLTSPFAYITLNGRLTLYAKKDATDQLRRLHNVSVHIVAREMVEDCYVVTARATMPGGRTDESIGVVNVAGLKGDARGNALMRSETKAKRRVTLSICGLGWLDESETETIPGAVVHAEEPAPEAPAPEGKTPTPATAAECGKWLVGLDAWAFEKGLIATAGDLRAHIEAEAHSRHRVKPGEWSPMVVAWAVKYAREYAAKLKSEAAKKPAQEATK